MISKVTDSIKEDVVAWRNRPQKVHQSFTDALVTKMQADGSVSNHAVYVALGVNLEGTRRSSAFGYPRMKAPSFG